MLFLAVFSSSTHFRGCVATSHFVGPKYDESPHRYTVHTYSYRWVTMMDEKDLEVTVVRTSAIAMWYSMLRDDAALLANPGGHHKALLIQAHELHRDQLIDRDELSDLLEHADGALAYAVEVLYESQPSD